MALGSQEALDLQVILAVPGLPEESGAAVLDGWARGVQVGRGILGLPVSQGSQVFRRQVSQSLLFLLWLPRHRGNLGCLVDLGWLGAPAGLAVLAAH